MDHLDLLRNDIHSGHMMMLGKQCGNLQTNITSARNGDFVILHVIYSSVPHRAYPLIFAPMYTSCISGWYFIFIISCVISHSSIKNNFEYTPQPQRPVHSSPCPHLLQVHTRQAVFNPTMFITDIHRVLLSLSFCQHGKADALTL